MIQLIRGFKDILPGEVELWQQIEAVARQLLEDFGFQEIRIPIMEKTELFKRSIGEDTDIVEKEMYTFADSKGKITLRPEATASIVRSYIQHKMYAVDPVKKLYMIGPMFRRERPQKGRYRQFYQIDAEVFGVASGLVDAQLIFLLTVLCKRLNISDVEAHINSLGCPACRPTFRKALDDMLAGVSKRLCADCNRRKVRNPLRVLDCKVPACREAMVDAPAIMDYLCPACREDFELVQQELGNLKVPYHIDKRLVRGLDYYTRTTFEIQTGSLGAQSAVTGGGRYDNLVQELGGPDIPATGFAIGFDRLAELVGLNAQDYQKQPQVFLAPLGTAGRLKAFEWNCELGTAGIRAEMEYADKGLKAQMKRANRLKAAYVVIVGDEELNNGVVILRDMHSKEQREIPVGELVAALNKIFNP